MLDLTSNIIFYVVHFTSFHIHMSFIDGFLYTFEEPYHKKHNSHI